MLNNFRLISLLLFSLLGWSENANAVACGGRFPNPVTDVCWLCMFPMHIGPVPMHFGQPGNGDPAPPLVCNCPAPPPIFQRIGVGLSFWEPARIAEVVRTPMCSPTLGGEIMGVLPVPAGGNSQSDGKKDTSFYHVHWFQYPVLSWLGMAISESVCFVSEPFDMQYLTELDPLWDDDELAFILNPEAVLFANPITQAACVADTVKASVTNFGFDPLFWCSGSQGSLYPLGGTKAGHVGGIDSSLNAVHRHVARMHKELLAQDTSTYAAICGGIPQPIVRKKQYKQQMMYPVPWIFSAFGFGVPSVLWGAGREFPYEGEDYSYLVWRKRTCCAF